MWAEVIERDYEGYVAKDETSTYEGGPTMRWLKLKQTGWALAKDRSQRRISQPRVAELAHARASSEARVTAAAHPRA